MFLEFSFNKFFSSSFFSSIFLDSSFNFQEFEIGDKSKFWEFVFVFTSQVRFKIQELENELFSIFSGVIYLLHQKSVKIKVKKIIFFI